LPARSPLIGNDLRGRLQPRDTRWYRGRADRITTHRILPEEYATALATLAKDHSIHKDVVAMSRRVTANADCQRQRRRRGPAAQ
jgi:hypothetical protein